MTEALRACPFCGGAAKVRSAQCAEDAVETWVECKECGAISERTEDAYADHPTAIHLWNRRAPVALPSREEVAAELHSWLFADRDEPANSEWEKLSESRQWAFLGAADAILNLMRERMG